MPENSNYKLPIERANVTRRGFLKSALIAAAGIPVVAAGCEANTQPPAVEPTPALPTQLQYFEVPPSPDSPPAVGMLRYFTPHEARTVEALTARILPGTPEDPGAREAGVVWYIDNLLAFREGYAEATYREPPYAQIYDGEQPPDDTAFDVIWVAADQIERYGYQSVLTPREVYRVGLSAVDQHSQQKFGSNVIDLSEDQQDTIIQDLLDNNATTFNAFTPESFFHVLRRHTSEGMFGDPVYGGNRDMVGWFLVGYPGAQRAYTPDELLEETETFREPQSLEHMSHFSPGEGLEENYVILPVSGSDIVREDPDEHTRPQE